MYISKANRKFIDELRSSNSGFNCGSDNYIMTIIKKTDKAVKDRIVKIELDNILENDPLGLLS